MRFIADDSVRKTVAVDQEAMTTTSSQEAPIPTKHTDLQMRDEVEIDTPDEIVTGIEKVERLQAVDDEDDETSYYLTITDTNWKWGNPTGVTTSSDEETTVTYLLFTKTTMMWFDPYENFDSSTIVWASFRSSMTTVPTATDDDEEKTTSEADPDKETETETETENSTGQSTLSTYMDTSVTSTSGATQSPEITPGNDSSDLPQAAIIGISVGMSVLTIAVVAVLLVFFRRRHKKDDHDPPARGGSPSPEEPPKAEGARPIEENRPADHSFAYPAAPHAIGPGAPEQLNNDFSGGPRAASAPVSELDHNAHLNRFPGPSYQQHAAVSAWRPGDYHHPLQPPMDRNFQAYHPSYGHHGTHQKSFVAELPADAETR